MPPPDVSVRTEAALLWPNDLSNQEWSHVEGSIPPVKRGGNRRHLDVCEVMNGFMYILSKDPAAMPQDVVFPSSSPQPSTDR